MTKKSSNPPPTHNKPSPPPAPPTVKLSVEEFIEKLKKNDPLWDLKQEYGRMLFKHIDDFTAEERKRYDELTTLLTKN